MRLGRYIIEYPIVFCMSVSPPLMLLLHHQLTAGRIFPKFQMYRLTYTRKHHWRSQIKEAKMQLMLISWWNKTVCYNTSARCLEHTFWDMGLSRWNDFSLWNHIELHLKNKSDTSHSLDNRYYTESEINSKLNGKSNTNHTHKGALSYSGTNTISFN